MARTKTVRLQRFFSDRNKTNTTLVTFFVVSVTGMNTINVNFLSLIKAEIRLHRSFFRGMDTLSRRDNFVVKIVLVPSKKESTLKGKNLRPLSFERRPFFRRDLACS